MRNIEAVIFDWAGTTVDYGCMAPVQAFVKAVKYMSPRKIGALVSIEQTQTLQEQIATGIPLDAVVTGELLINIFIPNTPLHDGAVII